MSVLYGLLLLLALAPLGRALLPRMRLRAGYPRLIVASWVRFGLPPLLILGGIGRWDAFGRIPAEFGPVVASLGLGPLGASDRRYLALSGAIGVAAGIGASLVLTAWRAWRGRPEGTLFGDASAVLPRGPDDYGWAALVSLTAGLTEEAYFRLLLPLLTALATGSALAGFVGATLLFGAAHRYQGWRGVAATTVAGTALTAGYLATGSILLMMALHAGGDLGHLVLRPALRRAIERRRAGASPRRR